MTVAALYVDADGVYAGLEGVAELWPRERDARRYPGPLPVVAHPPCERWGQLWKAGGRFGGGPVGGRRDARTCSKRCRQARQRWLVNHGEPAPVAELRAADEVSRTAARLGPLFLSFLTRNNSANSR